jgi:hypothetical protein
MGERTSPVGGPSGCPRCHGAIATDGAHCAECGFTLAGVPFFDPKHFLWLGLLLSALVPIYFSARNWGRMGQLRLQRLWLGGGVLGFMLLFAFVEAIPELNATVSRMVSIALNVPLSIVLRDRQRPLFMTAMQLGARRGSLFKGTLVGTALVLGVLAVVLAGLAMGSRIVYSRGVTLMAEENYADAARMFEYLRRHEFESDGPVFLLAFCHFKLKRYSDAALGFEEVVRRNPRSADGYAYLAVALAAQGCFDQADSVATLARQIEPDIFFMRFGEDGPNADPVARPKRVHL